jgi:hypothetical protein
MGESENTQHIVLIPRAHNSGWSKRECHTPDEAFAIAADLYERGKAGINIVDIEKGTCIPFVSFLMGQSDPNY